MFACTCLCQGQIDTFEYFFILSIACLKGTLGKDKYIQQKHGAKLDTIVKTIQTEINAHVQ